ncbi:hypothetical protein N7520_007168 [Penicillium odoratum]|uniref:uncharacterized protein n=1 Tax=Penicillium odoratum TaxID=1167516 RepID=UPI0025486628|nr:uncharacterized protein N7520_007168 [Penicillium odoratum]KAJ5760012.1 hypothetical protein N7520_007168 [Penicillium odoratum]
MKLLASLALLAATTLANPVVSRSSKEFKLKTTGSANPDFNDLYLYSYHTGAGLSDGVLDSNASVGTKFSLNGTTTYADLGTTFSWGLSVAGDTNYAAWEPVTINAGTSESGFTISNGNFVWSTDLGFAGWLVCSWYHNAPQLFGLVSYYDPVIPSSCSKVTLTPVY